MRIPHSCDENSFELFIYRHHIYYVNNLRTIRITRFARDRNGVRAKVRFISLIAH